MWLALATAALAAMAWLGLREFEYSDYENEARSAVESLVHGHLGAFLAQAPAYGGSLLERAPFALVANLWGGGEPAVFQMLALPCLLAGGALGVWLTAWMRRDGQGLTARAVALFLCVASPLTLQALEIGHPEELLGGVLCVAAVLLAARGRGVWAGVALGLAIANKQWAVLAIGPVLLALPSRRVLCLACAGAVCGALLAPFALQDSSAFIASEHGAATAASSIFQPWQVWWFFGHHGVVRGTSGAIKAGYRLAPSWASALSHPLIVASTFPLTTAAWLRKRRTETSSDAPETSTAHARREADALLLLALLLLLRCMLDTWDNVYYPIPFVLALLAWEALSRKRLAVLALAATAAVSIDHGQLGAMFTPDGQSLLFIAWTVPLALWLATVLYAPGALARLLHRGELLGKARQPLMALLGNDDEVLDAHAEATG